MSRASLQISSVYAESTEIALLLTRQVGGLERTAMASDTDCAKLTATRRHLSRWSTAQQHTACRSKTLRATRSHPIIHHAPRGIPHHDKRAKSGAPHPCPQSILPRCTVCRRSNLQCSQHPSASRPLPIFILQMYCNCQDAMMPDECTESCLQLFSNLVKSWS